MPVIRRLTYSVVMVVCVTFAAQSVAKEDTLPERPNILWIVGENFDTDFGCYGGKNVRTPNVDGLAAAGVRYTNVFSTSPVCAPSRSALMTGYYQTTTDMHHMRSHRDDDYRLPAGIRPLTHWLADAGYFTANVKTIGEEVVGTGKFDLNFVNEGSVYNSDDWSALKDNQPFFAQINTPEAEYNIYDRKSREKDRVMWVGEDWHPQIATPNNVKPPPYYPDHEITRQEWARYLNSVSGVDIRIGKVLAQLEADGVADNTVVIFFADNGRLEQRGIHWCYDSGLHVPMVIRWPKSVPAPPQFEPGTVNDDVISLIDLMATTLWMAGVEIPLGMHSRVFLGEQRDPPRTYAFSARDRIDETVHRIRSVRDKRYRYNRNYMPEVPYAAINRYKEKCFLVNPLMRKLHGEGKLTGAAARWFARRKPEEELYDTRNDPYEINNLAESSQPEHREALVRMRAALDTWVSDTGDRGHIPEAEEIVAPFKREMHDWFGTPDWAK